MIILYQQSTISAHSMVSQMNEQSWASNTKEFSETTMTWARLSHGLKSCFSVQRDWGKCQADWMVKPKPEEGPAEGYCQITCGRCICPGAPKVTTARPVPVKSGPCVCSDVPVPGSPHNCEQQVCCTPSSQYECVCKTTGAYSADCQAWVCHASLEQRFALT